MCFSVDVGPRKIRQTCSLSSADTTVVSAREEISSKTLTTGGGCERRFPLQLGQPLAVTKVLQGWQMESLCSSKNDCGTRSPLTRWQLLMCCKTDLSKGQPGEAGRCRVQVTNGQRYMSGATGQRQAPDVPPSGSTAAGKGAAQCCTGGAGKDCTMEADVGGDLGSSTSLRFRLGRSTVGLA